MWSVYTNRSLLAALDCTALHCTALHCTASHSPAPCPQVETCHYTYVTLFTPHQEQVCSDNYKKKCSIVFVTRSSPETVRTCYRPLEQDCSQEGSLTCRTYLESTCTTRYTAKAGGGSLGDTSCSRQPRELCGAGCRVREGQEECHEKQVDSVTEAPEEQCELSPQELCHQVR